MERCTIEPLDIRTTVRSDSAGQGQGVAPTEDLRPPLDLRQWIDPWTLAGWTEKEVEKLRDESWPIGPGNSFRRTARLLVFAYASRVFDSEEVVRKCHVDPVFRVLCDGEPPIARELWSFRRNNRMLLQDLLSRVLLYSVRERFGLDATVPQPGLEQDLRQHATERLNIARHMDQR
jgi:hypothetical protein